MHGDKIKALFHHPGKLLSTGLGLVANHSLVFGLTLIAQPDALMEFVGFNPNCDHFFPARCGIFHLLMFVVYFTGASHIEKISLFHCIFNFRKSSRNVLFDNVFFFP